VPVPSALRRQIERESSVLPDVTTVPIDTARRALRELALEVAREAGPPASVGRVEDSEIALGDRRIPIRVYLPREGNGPHPVCVYLHGGGWVFGGVEEYDGLCREIAHRARTAVVFVGYRRSPEHRFPAAVDDCYAVLTQVADPAVGRRWNLDSGRVALAGDSAGGNMSAVVCVQARDRHGPRPRAQILIYPVTDYFPDTPSYRDNATGLGLDASFMPWMWAQYLRSPADGADPRVAPLRTRDLSALPPATVITAEYDILRDEGELFAGRLQEAGGAATVTRYAGMVHGFLDYRGIVREGWDAIDEVASALRRSFES
jgi:acetyl esterase